MSSILTKATVLVLNRNWQAINVRTPQEAWENLVWSAKEVNQRKADRLPHEAGLKLLSVPRAPRELPVSALLRNAHSIPDWRLFLVLTER